MVSGVVGIAAGMAAAVAIAWAPASDGDVVRWDKPVLTVDVVDEQAWAGTDVAAALEQWSPAIPLVLVDEGPADITLTAGEADRALVGATATRQLDGSEITGCRVALPAQHHGADNTVVLTHELGHCLGIVGHLNGSTGSIMNWTAFGEGFSTTVTAADLDAVRALHR